MTTQVAPQAQTEITAADVQQPHFGGSNNEPSQVHYPPIAVYPDGTIDARLTAMPHGRKRRMYEAGIGI